MNIFVSLPNLQIYVIRYQDINTTLLKRILFSQYTTLNVLVKEQRINFNYFCSLVRLWFKDIINYSLVSRRVFTITKKAQKVLGYNELDITIRDENCK